MVILAYMVPIFVWYGAMGSTWYRLWKKIDALKVSKDAPDSPDEDTCAVGKELFDWIKTRSGDLRASKYLFTRVVAALVTFLAFCLIAVFVGGHLFWPLEVRMVLFSYFSMFSLWKPPYFLPRQPVIKKLGHVVMWI